LGIRGWISSRVGMFSAGAMFETMLQRGRRSLDFVKPAGPGEDVTMTHDGYMRLAIECNALFKAAMSA